MWPWLIRTIWLPRKLEQALALLQRLEALYGVGTPLLVHSDLELVDGQAQPMGAHYLQCQRLDPQRTDPADLALTNVVTGCTALCKRAILQLALAIPAEALRVMFRLSERFACTLVGQHRPSI